MTGNGTAQPCSVLKRKRKEQPGMGKVEWGPVMEKWSKAENRNGIVEEKALYCEITLRIAAVRCGTARSRKGRAVFGNGMAQQRRGKHRRCVVLNGKAEVKICAEQ